MDCRHGNLKTAFLSQSSMDDPKPQATASQRTRNPTHQKPNAPAVVMKLCLMRGVSQTGKIEPKRSIKKERAESDRSIDRLSFGKNLVLTRVAGSACRIQLSRWHCVTGIVIPIADVQTSRAYLQLSCVARSGHFFHKENAIIAPAVTIAAGIIQFASVLIPLGPNFRLWFA